MTAPRRGDRAGSRARKQSEAGDGDSQVRSGMGSGMGAVGRRAG